MTMTTLPIYAIRFAIGDDDEAFVFQGRISLHFPGTDPMLVESHYTIGASIDPTPVTYAIANLRTVDGDVIDRYGDAARRVSRAIDDGGTYMTIKTGVDDWRVIVYRIA